MFTIYISFYMAVDEIIKKFGIFLWKKSRFRLRWASNPGLSIAGRLIVFSQNAFEKSAFKVSKNIYYMEYLRYIHVNFSLTGSSIGKPIQKIVLYRTMFSL